MQKLKELVLATHNYHDIARCFPAPAIRDERGKPLLSWRVHLLPVLGEESLYRQFHLDEPWDSEHNRKLIPSMPDVLRSPASQAAPGTTTFCWPEARTRYSLAMKRRRSPTSGTVRTTQS